MKKAKHKWVHIWVHIKKPSRKCPVDPNDVVSVSYRIGGGSIGNIPANTLTTLIDPLSLILNSRC